MESNPLKTLFLSPDEARLRAGWRLILQTALLLFFSACISIPLVIYMALSGNIQLLASNNIGAGILFWNDIFELIVFTASIYLARRFLDKRSFSSLGLESNARALWDICAGVIITFAMMSVVYIIELAAGWAKFQSFAWQSDSIVTIIKQVGLFFVIFAITAWNEELLSRGYHLQTISSGTNRVWGVILSSSVFGALHLGNPNAAWVSAVGIFFAGLFFAYGYMRTGQLWLPIGMHLGWNFFEGVVFGFPVSGLDIYPLMRNQFAGPEIWNGGAFGPEAGLIMLPSLAIGFGLVYLYSKYFTRTISTTRRNDEP